MEVRDLIGHLLSHKKRKVYFSHCGKILEIGSLEEAVWLNDFEGHGAPFPHSIDKSGNLVIDLEEVENGKNKNTFGQIVEGDC